MSIAPLQTFKAADSVHAAGAKIVPILRAKRTGTRRRKPPTVIAITSGESRAGRTTVTANLAVALAARGSEVLVLDADFGHASVDALLGIEKHGDISHLLAAERSVDEILVQGPPGVHSIPGCDDGNASTAFDVRAQAALIRSLDTLRKPVDVVLIDTAAGFGTEVATFARAAHHVVVVVGGEPASADCALKLITSLSRERAVDRFKLLTNRTLTAFAGTERVRELRGACDQLLDVTLEYVGNVPYDYSVRRAARSRRPVMETTPRSRAAHAFRALAAQVETWARPTGLRGHLEFFVDRLVEADDHRVAPA